MIFNGIWIGFEWDLKGIWMDVHGISMGFDWGLMGISGRFAAGWMVFNGEGVHNAIIPLTVTDV